MFLGIFRFIMKMIKLLLKFGWTASTFVISLIHEVIIVIATSIEGHRNEWDSEFTAEMIEKRTRRVSKRFAKLNGSKKEES